VILKYNLGFGGPVGPGIRTPAIRQPPGSGPTSPGKP
jgi:hypothetical protein